MGSSSGVSRSVSAPRPGRRHPLASAAGLRPSETGPSAPASPSPRRIARARCRARRHQVSQRFPVTSPRNGSRKTRPKPNGNGDGRRSRPCRGGTGRGRDPRGFRGQGHPADARDGAAGWQRRVVLRLGQSPHAGREPSVGGRRDLHLRQFRRVRHASSLRRDLGQADIDRRWQRAEPHRRDAEPVARYRTGQRAANADDGQRDGRGQGELELGDHHERVRAGAVGRRRLRAAGDRTGLAAASRDAGQCPGRAAGAELQVLLYELQPAEQPPGLLAGVAELDRDDGRDDVEGGGAVELRASDGGWR